MSEEAPPKLPWYATIALVTMALLGLNSCVGGAETLALYRGAQLSTSEYRFADRAQAEVLIQHVLDSHDAVRKFAFPLSAAAMVIGSAMIAMATVALLIRRVRFSRIAQLLAVHALVFVLSQLATQKPRMALAELFAFSAMSNAETDAERQARATYRQVPASAHLAVPIVHTLLTAAIAFALTRRRASEMLFPADSEA